MDAYVSQTATVAIVRILRLHAPKLINAKEARVINAMQAMAVFVCSA